MRYSANKVCVMDRQKAGITSQKQKAPSTFSKLGDTNMPCIHALNFTIFPDDTLRLIGFVC